MQSIIPGQISSIPVIVLIIAIAAILLILLFMKIYQLKQAARKKGHSEAWSGRTSEDIITPFPELSEIKGTGPSEKELQPEDVQISDLGDITKNLYAVVSKYHIDSITLSTTDGLMIATTGENGQDDAAHYGHVLKPGEIPSAPGITLFFLTHKGSSVVGIIRSGKLVPDLILENIRNDTEKIMKWWI
jgi:hypothetical protein